MFANTKVAMLVLSGFIMMVAACGADVEDGSDESSGVVEQSVACNSQAVVRDWSAGQTYAEGELVHFRSSDYRCLHAHTAVEGWTPTAVPALWKRVILCPAGVAVDDGSRFVDQP